MGDYYPSSGGGGSSGGEVIHVSTTHLIATALPLLLVAYVGHHFDLGVENGLIIGIVRSFTQLMALGMILKPIFVIGMDAPWIVALYVFVIIIIATYESLSRQKYRYKYSSLVTFSTIFISVSTVGSFAFLLVIRPEPYWNPQYVIPICGMLMGNCINGVSLAIKTFSIYLKEGGQREIELYLSFGATGWESVERLAKEAISTGTTPMINSLNIIGMISIPGMMTGQILGGSPVSEAAHYQILIIYLIATCTFLTIFMNIYAMYRVAFDNGSHIFQADSFIKVEKKKLSKSKRFKLALNSSKIFAKKLKVLGFAIGAFFYKAICCFKVGFYCLKGIKKFKDLDEEISNLEGQVLVDDPGGADTNYGSSFDNKVQILSKKGNEATESVIFRISNLQLSIPMTSKKRELSGNESSLDHSLTSSTLMGEEESEGPTPIENMGDRKILFANLCGALAKGEIGIVRGPSGAGKSSLMRCLSGLSEADSGDVFVADSSATMLLSDCISGSAHKDMVGWRSKVRYVTQYKVDIPGTPQDFIDRIKRFHSYSACEDTCVDLESSTAAYLEEWGMGALTGEEHNSYLDKEWKSLSGGESQRMLLAIALSTRPQILLLDESTSGLEAKMEQRVEKSLVGYVNEFDAAVLWVTHSEDIAARLLDINE